MLSGVAGEACVNQPITPFFITRQDTNHINTYYEWCGKYAGNIKLYLRESYSNGSMEKVLYIKQPQCKLSLCILSVYI